MSSIAIIYRQGDKLGPHGIPFIREVDPYNWHGRNYRMAEFQCHCGNKFVTTIQKAKLGHTWSCGCFRKTNIGKVSTTHGLSNHRLRFKWSSIKGRLFDPNVKGYPNYGGRGITMYAPWIHNPKAFIEYCLTLEGCDNRKLSLDRINNDGNYEPGNLRFTTKNIQTRNRRKLKVNTSGYIGVSYDVRNNEWQSYIYENWKKNTIYRGKSKEEAACRRDEYIISNHLIGYKLNLQ